MICSHPALKSTIIARCSREKKKDECWTCFHELDVSEWVHNSEKSVYADEEDGADVDAAADPTQIAY